MNNQFVYRAASCDANSAQKETSVHRWVLRLVRVKLMELMVQRLFFGGASHDFNRKEWASSRRVGR